MIARIAVVTFAMMLAGCASSRLTVAVDLYDEDPRSAAPMSPEEAVRMIDDVEQLRAAAREKTSQRKLLATMSRDIFLDTWAQADGEQTRADSVEEKHAGYVQEADEALASLQAPLDKAVAQLTSYTTDYQDAYVKARKEFTSCEAFRLADDESRRTLPVPEGCTVYEQSKRVERLSDEWVVRRLPPDLHTKEAVARAEVSKAIAAYRGFASPLTKSFAIDWPSLRSSLYLGLQVSQQAGMTTRQMKLEQAIQAFNTRMADLAATTKLIPKQTIADSIAAGSASSPATMLDATMRVAVELETLRADLPETATAQTALAGLVRGTTQFIEQIDRLQDNGNPVWRIVTDPANEAHWNQQPGQTTFYAEGKSSVVMVRHDPMRYDVHEGTNNPTALIKGQLEISRAVANAALSIAGTATGLRLSAGEGTPTTDAEATTASTAASTFARRKADADEAERSRERTLRALELALSGILANIAAGGDNATVLATQRSRLESVLKAYRLQLDSAR